MLSLDGQEEVLVRARQRNWQELQVHGRLDVKISYGLGQRQLIIHPQVYVVVLLIPLRLTLPIPLFSTLGPLRELSEILEKRAMDLCLRRSKNQCNNQYEHPEENNVRVQKIAILTLIMVPVLSAYATDEQEILAKAARSRGLKNINPKNLDAASVLYYQNLSKAYYCLEKPPHSKRWVQAMMQSYQKHALNENATDQMTKAIHYRNILLQISGEEAVTLIERAFKIPPPLDRTRILAR